MGFSIGWLATRGCDPQEVYAALGVKATGVRQAALSARAMGGPVAGGWHLVVMDHRHDLVEDSIMRELSRSGEAVASSIEEHVMCSISTSWKGGQRQWAVVHDSEKGRQYLEVQGDVPKSFAALRAGKEEEQRLAGGDEADVDYIFDIPLDLAQELAGFRHDVDNRGLELEVLEVTRRSWWRRLIGQQ